MECYTPTGERLLSQVVLASHFFSRLKGLLGHPGLESEQALLIEPCNSVHTLGMRFAIAVVFLDREYRILHVIPEMLPGRLSPLIKGAKRVLELQPERCAELGLEPGQQLVFKP